MALTRLPTELLDNIITHTLAEGFEGVALTCRRIYALCTPFIERHNTLRSHFSSFNYLHQWHDPSYTIRTAFDLITRIAVEPIVARYVRHADFKIDSLSIRGRPREFGADVHCGDAVARLLAASPYLKQAGLDWQEYYNEIEEDLQARLYSQRAAAFLLTLLPNIETSVLPRRWKPLSVTDKLIDTVVRKAKQWHHSSCDTPGLAHTARFEPYLALLPAEQFDLAWAIPFLALPRMRCFYGPSCVAMDDGGHKSIDASKDQYRSGFGEALEAVDLVGCCIDEVGIADFLKHATRLRSLRYSHSTKRNSGPPDDDWDICKFVTAIEREVGSHIGELSVSMRELRGSIAPGRVSMSGFQRLRKLELPLEIAVCNITAAAARPAATLPNESLADGDGSTDYHELDDEETFIVDLVPASVSQLSLLSRGTDDHAKVLDVMFRHFAARKESTLPALEEIQLSCPNSADDEYKEQCARLLAETEKVGVYLDLKHWPACVTMTWIGND